ncbi:hypothetical protein DFA_00048 [Cavenderia fasciculata]|uniref:Uncharacterized protein n=1 Tax=Cavenderia fasciculata TaxID=261658 RepID=F4PXG1_CACFS|nr:uncharacterized protein DFA_00048 [Cavenderia fasciculata]EGG19471.1 hypothetical protein DFA_00048 [Cavenderia fasciculata]|eukprot:XP_004357765.1 hypothetical protein DFA_00048 [Cavenderia fasciculata]
MSSNSAVPQNVLMILLKKNLPPMLIEKIIAQLQDGDNSSGDSLENLSNLLDSLNTYAFVQN